MSMRQLPEPCWIVDGPNGWGDSEHLTALTHYASESAARAAIAITLAEDAAETDDPADRLGDLAPAHNPAGCWIVRCDECGQPARQEDISDGPLHFATREHAISLVGDWRTDRTGRPSLCPGCAAAADCESYGHEFGDWYACRCNGQVAWHAAHGCPDYRYCLRCGINDHPAYPDTPTATRREVA